MSIDAGRTPTPFTARLRTGAAVATVLAIATVSVAACSSSGGKAGTSSPALTVSSGAPTAGTSSMSSPASTSTLTCPSAAALSTPAGVTYDSEKSTPGADPGVEVCEYSIQGTISMLVSLYPPGTSLKDVTANDPTPPTAISGLGDSAAHLGTFVYVANTSTPTFSVIDQTGDLSLAQAEAVARVVLG